MNIDRVAPSASELGLRRTESPSRPFDLTISDQGVRANRAEQGRQALQDPPVAREEATAPINSSQALGQLLTVEETRALREAFAPEIPTQAPDARGGVYNIRGQAASAAQRSAQGSLLDITG